MENTNINSRRNRGRVLAMICLVLCVLGFIFCCMRSILPIGAGIVGTFGWIIYPELVILAFVSLAKFLGFSYGRSFKALALFGTFVFSVLFVVHCIGTFSSLDAVTGAEELKNYLLLSYDKVTVFGLIGSIPCGILSLILGAFGTIIVFVIVATLSIGLFVDFELYGKYEDAHIKKLKSKKLRQKVNKSTEKSSGVPDYSFNKNSNLAYDDTDVVAETQMTLEEETVSKTGSQEKVSFKQTDVHSEIEASPEEYSAQYGADPYSSGSSEISSINFYGTANENSQNSANFGNFNTNSANYSGGVQNLRTERTDAYSYANGFGSQNVQTNGYEYQDNGNPFGRDAYEKPQFSSDVYEENYPNAFTDSMDETRRQFMEATFGGRKNAESFEPQTNEAQQDAINYANNTYNDRTTISGGNPFGNLEGVAPNAEKSTFEANSNFENGSENRNGTFENGDDLNGFSSSSQNGGLSGLSAGGSSAEWLGGSSEGSLDDIAKQNANDFFKNLKNERENESFEEKKPQESPADPFNFDDDEDLNIFGTNEPQNSAAEFQKDDESSDDKFISFGGAFGEEKKAETFSGFGEENNFDDISSFKKMAGFGTMGTGSDETEIGTRTNVGNIFGGDDADDEEPLTFGTNPFDIEDNDNAEKEKRDYRFLTQGDDEITKSVEDDANNFNKIEPNPQYVVKKEENNFGGLNQKDDAGLEKTVGIFGAGKEKQNERTTISSKPEFKKGINMGMNGIRYNPPPLSLLKPLPPDNGDYSEEQKRKSDGLEEALKAFNIPAKVVNIIRGPKITRYELSVPLGVPVKRIPMYELDIKRALAAKTINIQAPIPGSSYVGIELENDTFTSVSQRELLESEAYQNFKDPLPIAVGKDISGEIVVKSLAKMVHLLIAGSTGSGKSVFIHSIVMSLIYRHSPEELRLIMIDPKKVEFNRYNGLPHLLTPEIVMGADKAVNALKWCVKEMERRYELLSKSGYNNIEPYNRSENVKAGQLERFPYIVIIVDELAEIMMANKKEVEAYIQRITQLARACGMHMILATQRPSVDIISGVIKNNVPSRIAFSLSSGIDSKTILNTVGAEKLLGQGDMLFSPNGTASMPRLQAAYCSDEEIRAVIDYDIQNNSADFDEAVSLTINAEPQGANEGGGMASSAPPPKELDSYFKIAVKYVMQNGSASTSYLQRRLSIGYSRAAKIIDQMEDRNYIAPATGQKVRKILITPDQFKEDFGEDFDSVDV